MPILSTASLILGLYAFEAPTPTPAAHRPPATPVMLVAGDALGMAMHRRHGDTPLRLARHDASIQIAATPTWTKPTTTPVTPTPWWFAMTQTTPTVAFVAHP